MGHVARKGGRWQLREAQRVFGLTKEEELYQHVREGTVTTYRAHIGDHWEWRVDLADPTTLERPGQPVGLQAAAQEV